MANSQDKFMKDVPSHFNWNLYQNSTVTFTSVKNSLDEHISQNPGQRTIEAYLFMSYFFMSAFKQNEKDSERALEYLRMAKREINKTTTENSPARIGFMTVALSNEAKVKSMLHKSREARNLKIPIEFYLQLSTEESQIYIDVVRAFALSRLGTSKYEQAKDLYKRALAKFQNNISAARSAVERAPEKLHWLFALALMIGRIARHKAGLGNFIDEMNEEIELYKMILEIDPEYALASAHLAQCYSLKKDSEAAKYYSSIAIRHGPNNPSVLRIAGKTLRKEKYFEEATTLFEQCESLGANNSYVYHQLGLLSRGKYFHGKRFGNMRSSLPTAYIHVLRKSIEYFTKAFDCGSSNCMALLDRARSYEELGDKRRARADYERLITRQSTVTVPDVVAIHLRYGEFLQRNDQRTDALDHFLTAIDNYCDIVSDSVLHADDTQLRPEQDGEKAMRYAIKIANEMICMESIQQRLEGHKCLAKVLFIKGKYGRACNEYERCLQIDDNCNDLEVMKGIVNCCLQMKEFRRAESFIDKLAKLQCGDITPLRTKLMLLEGEHEYSEGKTKEARDILTKAVVMGSLEACDKLFHLLKMADKDEQSQCVFRTQCAAILFCYSKAHSDYYDKTSVNITNEDEDGETDGLHGAEIPRSPQTLPDHIRSLVNTKHEVMGDVRKAIIDLEQIILENGVYETVETFNATMCVFSSVHQVLEHSIVALRKKFYPGSKNRSPYFYVRARDIAEPMTYDDVKMELLRRLDGTKDGNNKSYKWMDFDARFPELLDFLVKIQPGYDKENNWYIAVARLDNLHKHDKHFFQQYMCDAYDIPVAVRGTGDKAKDKDAEHVLPAGNRISGSGGAKMVRHPNAEYQVFRIRDLARIAATEAERIVSAFYTAINSPE